jgi:hypothetical protein
MLQRTVAQLRSVGIGRRAEIVIPESFYDFSLADSGMSDRSKRPLHSETSRPSAGDRIALGGVL